MAITIILYVNVNTENSCKLCGRYAMLSHTYNLRIENEQKQLKSEFCFSNNIDAILLKK